MSLVEVKNRDIRGSTKETYVLQIFLKKCVLEWRSVHPFTHNSTALEYYGRATLSSKKISLFAVSLFLSILQAHVETAELFERTNSEVYNRSGCMYRGLPPRHYTTYESERQKMTLSTANFTVIFNKVQVNSE